MLFHSMPRRPPLATHTDTSSPTRRSSDLHQRRTPPAGGGWRSDPAAPHQQYQESLHQRRDLAALSVAVGTGECDLSLASASLTGRRRGGGECSINLPSRYLLDGSQARRRISRSEEHTSELQSLMRNSYADVRLKKKKN